MPGTNTLAYCEHSQIPAVKSFIALIIYQVVGGRFTNGEHVIDEPSHAEAVQLVVEELHAQLAWNKGSDTLLLRPTFPCPWAQILDLIGQILLDVPQSLARICFAPLPKFVHDPDVISLKYFVQLFILASTIPFNYYEFEPHISV